MSLVQRARARLRALLRRTAGDRELTEEIRFHIDQETEKNARLGMSRTEARRVAVAHFGGVERVREDHRDVRRLPWLEDAAADARFAFRSMRRTPALASAAIVTLALGIGANVAIFSAVNAVVLQPLPFSAPDRLMTIGEDNPEKDWHMQFAAPANLLDWRTGVADFQDVTGYFPGVGSSTLTGRGDPQVLHTSMVMGNLFSTLGVRATVGRTFTFDETFASGTHVTVLSDRAWRQVFGADPSIIGKSIVLDGTPMQVIGVMPPGFSFPADGIDAWQTMEWSAKERADIGFRRAHGVRALARLKPGVTIAAANAQLQTVVERLKHQYPLTNRVMGASMVPLHDYLVGDTRLPLLVLLTSVAFLLLIACANVGNLLLVQAAGREREAALRLALGAGRGRLVRQALVESLVLSLAGGVFGLALGWAGTRLLVRLQPERMLRVHDFGVDTSVLLYVVGITLVSGLIFGVAPALWFRRRDPVVSLKEGGRGAALGRTARRWGEVLVICEVALALVMTVGAGLLVRSLLQLRHVDPGFDPHNVLVATVGLNNTYDTDAKQDAFMRQIQARIAALPGVTSVGTAMNVPLTGVSWTTEFRAYGRPADDFIPEIGMSIVSPSYFATMKEPILRGRAFTGEDRSTTTHVVVINETLAKTYFKTQDPIGQRIAFDKAPTSNTRWLTVIGVVGDEHSDGLDVTPRVEAFQSSTQQIDGYANLVVRTRGEPTAMTGSVRAVLRGMDPRIALLKVTTMDELRSRSLARTRFITILLLAFAGIGVTLAVVGVYGVLAQVSRNRTREMGIRLALGAQAAQVRWLVVAQGLRLALVGLVLGALAALAGTRVMGTLLFHVAPNDPLTLVAVAVLLAFTSLAASWLPALKASRADPALTMRAE
jgi:putative ABC transport system permease protein